MTDFEDIMALRGSDEEEPEKKKHLPLFRTAAWATPTSRLIDSMRTEDYELFADLSHQEDLPHQADIPDSAEPPYVYHQLPMDGISIHGPRTLSSMRDLLHGITLSTEQTFRMEFDVPCDCPVDSRLDLVILAEAIPPTMPVNIRFDMEWHIQGRPDIREDLASDTTVPATSGEFRLVFSTRNFAQQIPRGRRFSLLGSFRSNTFIGPIAIQQVGIELVPFYDENEFYL